MLKIGGWVGGRAGGVGGWLLAWLVGEWDHPFEVRYFR